MTHDEAVTLARRIVNTFRLTPAVEEWVDALSMLRLDVAAATVTKLRDETESGGLLIGRFMSHYRAALAAGGRRRETVCGTCRGDRYVAVLDERRHGPTCTRLRDGFCLCHAVVDCPACSVGHPTPYREDPPISLAEYRRRVLDRGDPEEIERLRRIVGSGVATASD